MVSRRRFIQTLAAISALLSLSVLFLARYMILDGERKVEYKKVKISNKSKIPENTSIRFSYPYSDYRQRNFAGPCILIRRRGDDFKALSAVCTHLQCIVEYETESSEGERIYCNCHAGVFDSKTGKVISGPPKYPLPDIKLEFDENGDIYANGVVKMG